MNRIDYLANELQKARQAMDTCRDIGDYVGYPVAEARYNAVAQEHTWLTEIDSALPFPHKWGNFEDTHGRIEMRAHVPVIIIALPTGGELRLDKGGFIWAYDWRYMSNNPPPPRMIANELYRDFLRAYPAVWGWIETVDLTNHLLPLLQPSHDNPLYLTVLGEPLSLDIWNVLRGYGVKRSAEWLNYDSSHFPEIDMYRQQAGDQWDQVATLCGWALTRRLQRIEWDPFKETKAPSPAE